eukprot:gene377-1768_t
MSCKMMMQSRISATRAVGAPLRARLAPRVTRRANLVLTRSGVDAAQAAVDESVECMSSFSHSVIPWSNTTTLFQVLAGEDEFKRLYTSSFSHALVPRFNTTVLFKYSLVQHDCAVQVLAGEDEFKGLIAEAAAAKDLVVVDFYTQWCGPCKLIAPMVEKMAQEYQGKGVRFAKVDCGKDNDSKKWAMALGIKVLPTFRLYKDGAIEHVQQVTGSKVEKIREAAEAQKAKACPRRSMHVQQVTRSKVEKIREAVEAQRA